MTPKLSQVLLSDTGWQQRCVARVPEAPLGIEWGCGDGALTTGLVERWDRTLGIELDEKLCRRIKRKIPGAELLVIRGDILTYPLPDSEQKYPVVGNLPYHVTGPILMRLLKFSNRISAYHGLVQQEVADRLTASPGESEYSSLSVLFALHGTTSQVFTIPPGAFKPSPDVDSAWVEFRPGNSYKSFESLRSFVRHCFRQPRKTLLNNLTDEAEAKGYWREFLESKELDPRIRPHQLKPELFLEVYEKWEKRKLS